MFFTSTFAVWQAKADELCAFSYNDSGSGMSLIIQQEADDQYKVSFKERGATVFSPLFFGGLSNGSIALESGEDTVSRKIVTDLIAGMNAAEAPYVTAADKFHLFNKQAFRTAKATFEQCVELNDAVYNPANVPIIMPVEAPEVTKSMNPLTEASAKKASVADNMIFDQVLERTNTTDDSVIKSFDPLEDDMAYSAGESETAVTDDTKMQNYSSVSPQETEIDAIPENGKEDVLPPVKRELYAPANEAQKKTESIERHNPVPTLSIDHGKNDMIQSSLIEKMNMLERENRILRAKAARCSPDKLNEFLKTD